MGPGSIDGTSDREVILSTEVDVEIPLVLEQDLFLLDLSGKERDTERCGQEAIECLECFS